jgi:hypothetical protein
MYSKIFFLFKTVVINVGHQDIFKGPDVDLFQTIYNRATIGNNLKVTLRMKKIGWEMKEKYIYI